MTAKQSAPEAKKNETKSQATTSQTPKKVKASQPTVKEKDKETSPLDLLLDRLEEDAREEREIDEEIDALRDLKKEVSNRVRDGIKYFAHLMDTATPEQQERLTALGVKPKSGKRELNRAAQIALSIMAEQKEPITNEDLYNQYLEVAEKEAGLPDTYPQFNVHLRAPERSGVLKRTQEDGESSSRKALISYHPEASEKYVVNTKDK